MAIRRLFTALPCLLALSAAAACTTAPAAPATSAPASPRATQQAKPATRPVLAGAAAGSVTLAFAGDVHFAGRTARLLSDPATAFGPVATVLRAADFSKAAIGPNAVAGSLCRRAVRPVKCTSPANASVTLPAAAPAWTCRLAGLA